MVKYVIKRVLLMLLTFFIIMSGCFILIRLLPNVPAQQFGKDMNLVLQRRVRQGLVDMNGNPIPMIQQYWHFITRTLIGGDWGVSESLYIGQDCFCLLCACCDLFCIRASDGNGGRYRSGRGLCADRRVRIC